MKIKTIVLTAVVALSGVAVSAGPSVTVGAVTPDATGSKISFNYTLGGLDAATDYQVVFEVTANGTKKSAPGPTGKLENRDYSNEIDANALFGKSIKGCNTMVKVSLYAVPQLGGVQLWANGPYWAECNVGASSQKESGGYYAFDQAKDVLQTPWRLPTVGELTGLDEMCAGRSYDDADNIKGRYFVNKNDSTKSIFLPAPGYESEYLGHKMGNYGYYMTSTKGRLGTFYGRYDADIDEDSYDADDLRISIRAVRDADSGAPELKAWGESSDAVVVTVTGHVASVTYDGTEKSVSGYDVVSISNPFYTADDFTFTGQSATNGTNAGTYPMGLKQAEFANKNPNFANVTFNVTDGELVIAQAAFPGGGEEPGGGSVPVGGKSKFDETAMYDGEGHTIRTNELVAAFKEAVGGDVSVQYACGGSGAPVLPWMSAAPDFTDVCETSVWYKVTSANYQDFTHEAKVTVTNRPVTLTSGTKTDFTYDGKPHAYTNLSVTAGSFVAGEGIATSNWATVTVVTEGEVPNAFDYEPLDGTKLSNYDFTVVTGKIAVLSPAAVTVTVTGHVASVVYNGLKKSVSGYDIVSISDPLYKETDFTFSGQSATNGTDVGTYPMGLKKTDFVNTNPNFETVTFVVTDGKLEITKAENAWTTEPAIENWTYGTTASVPVGAAKFGEVMFAYSPATVYPAGDYTMTASVAGTDNYTGLSSNVTFKILKATLPGGGEEPGGGEKPEGGVSKFDTVAMYDGEGHTIKTNELVAAFKTAVGGDVSVQYACGGSGAPVLPWMSAAPDFTDVCETSVWYKVTSANYQDFTHEAKVSVKPRDLSNVTIAAIPDQKHTGVAIEPEVVVTDGDPSIVTPADYDVGYSDNIDVGTATVTLTGKCNYTGTTNVTFKVVPAAAKLKAEIAWKLLNASGTYMAQLKVTCTSGFATGISNLRFMFADRVSGGTTFASLWDTPKRAAKSTTVSYNGDTYRYVALDTTRITAENVAVTYGVSNLAASSVPTAERTIELYVRKRVNPTTGMEEAAGVDNFVGYVSWTSDGETQYLPVVAGAQAAALSATDLMTSAPMNAAAINASLAVGAMIAEDSSPYCKLTEFSVSDDEIVGGVEVGSVSDGGTECPGKLGANATVVLLGTDDLGQDFEAISSVRTDSSGRFRLDKPKDCQFFKLKLTVEEVVE